MSYTKRFIEQQISSLANDNPIIEDLLYRQIESGFINPTLPTSLTETETAVLESIYQAHTVQHAIPGYQTNALLDALHNLKQRGFVQYQNNKVAITPTGRWISYQIFGTNF